MITKGKSQSFTFIIFSILVLACYWGVIYHFRFVAESDPDRYFHLALARMTAAHGLIRELPQVEHLGWGERFQEKNFLFTIITAGAYRLGGEAAAIRSIVFCSLCMGLLLYLCLSLHCSPALAAFWTILPLASPDFANRISLFRPHVMAMLFSILLLYGLLSRRKILAGLGASLYALSYHAHYVPIALMVLFGISLFWEQVKTKTCEKKAFQSLTFALFGLIAGICLNPYFPQSLYSTRNSVRMALNLSKVSEMDRPIEIIPMDTHEFIAQFGIYLAFLSMAWWLMAFSQFDSKKEEKGNQRQLHFLFLLFSATLFWFLAQFSRRALEYGIPLTVLLVSSFPSFRLRKALFPFGLMFSALVFFGPFNWNYYTHPLLPSIDTSYVLGALDSLPKESAAKIFNCEWDNGAYILYQRPKMHFIDITDPILLADRAPLDHLLRSQLKLGQIRDPYRLLHEHFKAQYVLCDHFNVQKQLENDLRFHRIYPKTDIPPAERRPGYTALYALLP